MKSVAENKKAQNIAEYIIYMYQMEDLIRSFDFNIDDIYQYVISHYPISEGEKRITSQWFESLIKEMKQENVEKTGHLESITKTADDLAKIHWELLKTDGPYFKLYSVAKPHIISFLSEAGESPPKHEIQVCLNGIYGHLLARLKGREIPDDLLVATKAFGDVLSYINLAYQTIQKEKVQSN